MTEDKPSEHLKSFLNYIKQCREEYSLNDSAVQELDRQTQDILHKIELEKISYHEHARLNIELSSVRKQRREAKDRVIVLKPIEEYAETNKGFLNSLSNLLGTVRKEEKRLENRMYFPKSEKYRNSEQEADKINN